MGHYYIEQQYGDVLGIYEANSESDAIEAMARDAGYRNSDEIPGGVDPDLYIEEADAVCADCGKPGLYCPDPDALGCSLSHDDQGRVLCDDCAQKRGLL